MTLIYICLVLSVLVGASLCKTTQPTTADEEKIYELYAELFKTEEEIQNLVNQSFEIWPPVSGREASRIQHHACCTSTVDYTAYSQLPDINNEQVDLIVLKGRKQYFLHEKCSQVNDCTCACTCKLITQLATALVCKKHHNCTPPKLESVQFQFVKFPSFCRCLNIGSPS
ncbi:uncharacterized protein LOC131941043 [Physella acuta]|uniref:uncharacterized protein LOC131941043 n=1 Tax=Physella acuta TaxID=109671 RepID=UPI0027DC923C|nr:uncharacterized protein LOC131941043 [Physella acuta]